MAYDLLASESTVHVLSALDVIDAQRATIKTPNHNAVVSSIVPATIWGTVAGQQQLNQVAFDVEWLLDHTAATAAIGNQSIDDNGLLTQVVTFTVAYTPPGSTQPPLTATVDVPMPWLEELIAPGSTSHPGLEAAVAVIEEAAAKLAAMAGQ
jgi:hypothetical protein